MQNLNTRSKVLIASAVAFLVSMFVMGAWYNRWTELAFYLLLMAYVVIALVLVSKWPIASAFNVIIGKRRYATLFVAAMFLVGFSVVLLDWIIHVATIFT